MRPPPREHNSGADERVPARRPADMPVQGGEALVEHLAERVSRAERELRVARDRATIAERDRAFVGRVARHVAEHGRASPAELTRLFLPQLGRWCALDEAVRGGAARTVVTHDAAGGSDAFAIDEPVRVANDNSIGLGRALRSGRIERLSGLPELRGEATPDERAAHLAIARLARGPLLIVPVLAGGRVVAALTLGRGEDEPEYDDAAQSLASELAPFVALVLQQRHIIAAAASASQAKAQFLTMMSHELRTPLNAIAGYAQLLEMGFRGPLNEAQQDAVSRILRGQEHLLELVDAVLTFSRLTSGKLVLESTPVAATSLLHDAHEQFDAQFSAQGIDFTVDECADATMVSADGDRAREVLRHLLANALKFTRRGGKVTLGCEVDADAVHFVVADTGRGIPSAHQESIFHPFVQVEKGLTRSVDGSGLGLAVGRELAERMGGTLTVTSEVDVGSRFVLTLPLMRDEAPPDSIDSPSVPG